MKSWTWMAGMLLVLALSACGASGPKTTFSATLNGASEVPAITTTATGSATLAVNDSTKVVTLTGSYSGLTPTVAHVHGPAGKTATAGVVFAITAAGGTLSGTFTASDAQLADLRAGNWYVNVHSAANPGGEIRGQLE